MSRFSTFFPVDDVKRFGVNQFGSDVGQNPKTWELPHQPYFRNGGLRGNGVTFGTGSNPSYIGRIVDSGVDTGDMCHPALDPDKYWRQTNASLPNRNHLVPVPTEGFGNSIGQTVNAGIPNCPVGRESWWFVGTRNWGVAPKKMLATFSGIQQGSGYCINGQVKDVTASSLNGSYLLVGDPDHPEDNESAYNGSPRTFQRQMTYYACGFRDGTFPTRPPVSGVYDWVHGQCGFGSGTFTSCDGESGTPGDPYYIPGCSNNCHTHGGSGTVTDPASGVTYRWSYMTLTVSVLDDEIQIRWDLIVRFPATFPPGAIFGGALGFPVFQANGHGGYGVGSVGQASFHNVSPYRYRTIPNGWESADPIAYNGERNPYFYGGQCVLQPVDDGGDPEPPFYTNFCKFPPP